jgi:hypothetical protein
MDGPPPPIPPPPSFGAPPASAPHGNTPATLIAIVALSSCAIGAVLGGFFTYTAMKFSTRRAAQTESVPSSPHFGQAQATPMPNGWWAYSFPDLDVAVSLPITVSPKPRKFTKSAASQIRETADYMGQDSDYGWTLGAFWTTTRPRDIVDVAKFNMSRSTDLADLKYTLNATTVGDDPACVITASYKEAGEDASFHMAYIQHGNGVYYLKTWYWTALGQKADADWAVALKSVRFLNKAPLTR